MNGNGEGGDLEGTRVHGSTFIVRDLATTIAMMRSGRNAEAGTEDLGSMGELDTRIGGGGLGLVTTEGGMTMGGCDTAKLDLRGSRTSIEMTTLLAVPLLRTFPGWLDGALRAETDSMMDAGGGGTIALFLDPLEVHVGGTIHDVDVLAETPGFLLKQRNTTRRILANVRLGTRTEPGGEAGVGEGVLARDVEGAASSSKLGALHARAETVDVAPILGELEAAPVAD